MIVHLPQSAFIVLKGADTHTFLNSVSTLDANNLNDSNATWGACLTPQGKMMYAFIAFVYKGAVYLQTDTDSLMEFGGWLSKYALNMKVGFSIEKNISAYADTNIVGSTAGDMTVYNDTVQIIDPRHADMGALLYVFNGADISATDVLESYHRHRIQNGIMDLHTDFEQNKTFALEALLDKQNGVNFEKGCYIGQEVTARTHFKGKVKKHIVPIECSNLKDVAVGDDIITLNDKTVGKILSVSGTVAMAMLRTEHIENKYVETVSGILNIIAPDWYFS